VLRLCGAHIDPARALTRLVHVLCALQRCWHVDRPGGGGLTRGALTVVCGRPGRSRDAFDDLFEEGMEEKLQHVTKVRRSVSNPTPLGRSQAAAY
jgi:hypothetical protein